MIANLELKQLMVLFQDFLKKYCWEFVSNCIDSSISTFLTSNREFLNKQIQYLSRSISGELILIRDLLRSRLPTFSISPMPDLEGFMKLEW